MMINYYTQGKSFVITRYATNPRRRGWVVTLDGVEVAAADTEANAKRAIDEWNKVASRYHIVT